jgi:hypothetical protein
MTSFVPRNEWSYKGKGEYRNDGKKSRVMVIADKWRITSELEVDEKISRDCD